MYDILYRVLTPLVKHIFVDEDDFNSNTDTCFPAVFLTPKPKQINFGREVSVLETHSITFVTRPDNSYINDWIKGINDMEKLAMEVLRQLKHNYKLTISSCNISPFKLKHTDLVCGVNLTLTITTKTNIIC